MSTNKTLTEFVDQLAPVQTLIPGEVKGKKIAQVIYTRQIVTIVGVKTTTSRFLPVSHAVYSNETYVDKLDLLGKTRSEFIGRKLKGIERRAHMTLFRAMVESYQKSDKQSADWQEFFTTHFGSACMIPDKLCLACWNCSLFGGMESQVKKAGTFSRMRYFDTYSVEDAAECIQTDDSPEQMAIGNTVGEDLSIERGPESFHRYEYVKAGTRFPFITIIESPTLLDVSGYLATVKLADQHGYGKYSASNGKFETEFLAVSTGYPVFSVFDMLKWLENNIKLKDNKTDDSKTNGNNDDVANSDLSTISKLRFEKVINQPVTLSGDTIDAVYNELDNEFKAYFLQLNEQRNDGKTRTIRKKKTE